MIVKNVDSRYRRYHTDPEYRQHVIDYNRDYRLAHPSEFAAYNRKYRARRVGLDEHADRIGPCEICGTVVERHWDHDHKTREHRGWLCGGCNRGLGQFQDDPGLLRRAASYLDRAALRVVA